MSDREDDIQRIGELYIEWTDVWEELDREMAEWLERHPVFRYQLGFIDEGGAERPSVANYQIDHVEGKDLDELEIESEWELAITFGYREAVADIVSSIDGRSDTLVSEWVEKSEENDE